MINSQEFALTFNKNPSAGADLSGWSTEMIACTGKEDHLWTHKKVGSIASFAGE